MKTTFIFRNGLLADLQEFNRGGATTATFRLIKERGKKFKPWVVVGVMMLCSLNIFSQSGGFCQFDEYYEEMIENGSFQTFHQNVETIIESMTNNPQAIMNDVIYRVPVVFHVIHLGEPEGSGSNINDGLILNALQQLNNDFRNTALNGYDVKIDFCMAQQDPEGCPTDGINRVNGTSVSGYLQNGINSSNDIAVKALSIWPNDQYINIWIVHNIASAPGSQILGQATFPNTPSDRDGIVLLVDIVGGSSESHVLTHEVGHFFNLYHTFHDTDASDCANLGDCHQQGDMICETRAHVGIVSAPCNETQFQGCDPSYNLPYLVSENHMNYTVNSCRDEFVPEQIMWMRSALMNLRTPLMNSIGCSNGCCTDFQARFDVPGTNNEFPINTQVEIANVSTGGTTFVWYIDYVEFSTTFNFQHTFVLGGNYTICLDAIGLDGCIDRYCEEIYIIPVCNPEDDCGFVQNGSFEEIDGSETSGVDINGSVCGWKTIQSSPYYCYDNENGSIALYLENDPSYIDIERVSTKYELNLVENKEYVICLNYWTTCGFSSPNCTPPTILVALTDNNNASSTVGGSLESTAYIIASIKPKKIDAFGQLNHECPSQEPNFHSYLGSFIAPSDNLKYLTLTGEPGDGGVSITFIDNIFIHDETEICCAEGGGTCVSVPEFTYQLEDCEVTFNGTYTGDPGTFYWDFGDGTTGTGENVSHEYIYGGTFNVCLTIQCDFETAYTICQEITIPEECDNCEENVINITSIQCSNDTSTTSYLADFDIRVPKGYKPCGEDFYAGSDDVAITSPSFMINTDDPLFDIISVSLVITPPSGYDLNTTPASGHITLCDSLGNMICYEFVLRGTSCVVCEELDQVIATCVIPQSDDSTFVYTGIIPLPNLPGSTYSETPGLVLGTPNGSGIPFTITTTQAGTFSSSTILVFEDDEVTTCYKLNIVIENACPIGCIPITEDVLNLMCEEEMIGTYTEFIINDIEFPRGFGPCRGSINGTVGGDGIVAVTSNTSPGIYDISIQMPPSYSMTKVYTITIVLCDSEGNEVEFCLDVVFMCGTGDRIASNTKEDVILEKYEVFPNPANASITISNLGLKIDNINYSYQLIDINGRILLDNGIKSKSEIIDISSYSDGLYLIKIFREEVGILSKTISIIKK